ncbi:hypothetical protein EVAR_37316_1 [Eumeta japonica]|uniref:Uncharacterized protein n=1 Tax=Eumeta variegata TaxID=151549 RepID=A0A4C1WXZ7_EUMVA|nr:hypothetical protein EVAR_37316_1 [Eumeta japonica]
MDEFKLRLTRIPINKANETTNRQSPRPLPRSVIRREPEHHNAAVQCKGLHLRGGHKKWDVLVLEDGPCLGRLTRTGPWVTGLSASPGDVVPRDRRAGTA